LSNTGVKLSLMIGPVVPVPVSQSVIDALQSARVTLGSDGPGVFQLTFSLDVNSPLHTLFLLAGGGSIPLVRVILVATLNGQSDVVIDGVMTSHQVSPGGDPGHATLTVTGEDLTRVMDYIDFSGFPFPGMPPEARVAVILAKYAFLGIVPVVIPSIMIDVPIPIDRIPRQHGKDLAYVKRLAENVGYVFYVTPGPKPGLSFAYWGPDLKVGVPQPALNTNLDAATNVESLSFEYDAQHATLPIVFIYEKTSKAIIPIPVPAITPLNPPLGLIPPIPKNIEPIRMSAKYSPVQAALIGIAKASKTADVVKGTGTLDVTRYGRLLKQRQLVGVRGVGPAFDGLYYVKGVTHDIKRGEYKQSFTLSRNGLLSTLPKVPA
jgi:hypothetical protein